MTILTPEKQRFTKTDIEDTKQRTDLRELATRSIELCKASGEKELQGPCPKCGGDDRFHVRADWFFCRHCHPKRGDAIEFIMWRDGVNFQEACARLDSGRIITQIKKQTPARKATRTTADDENWQRKITKIVDEAHDRLFDLPEGEAGRNYLLGRGLEPHTWAAFKLGFRLDVGLPGTWSEAKREYIHPPQPAIVIPWYRGSKVVAVRYRFLKAHQYKDIDGKDRSEKQTSPYFDGEQFAGRLFGMQALAQCAEDLRTLVLVEGEINAMSIWQEAHDSNVDVLSIGSEDQKLTPAMVDYAKQFACVVAWLDRHEKALNQAKELEACAISSPNGQDANDLLQAGLLGGFLTQTRVDACRANLGRGKTLEYQRERLLWNLFDAARLPGGVDLHTRKMILELAKQLGKQADLDLPTTGEVE
jgi:hypothetical protein